MIMTQMYFDYKHLAVTLNNAFGLSDLCAIGLTDYWTNGLGRGPI